MKLFQKLKELSLRKVGLATIAGVALGIGVIAGSPAGAAGSDCDNNAVVTGGKQTAAGFQDAYQNGSTCTQNGVTYTSSATSIQKIYACMGISQADVNNLKNLTVPGTVDINGNVWVDGKVVATNAKTGGRQNMSGSDDWTNKCNLSGNGNNQFYHRPPSASFQQSSLDALVAFDNNGLFKFAIINSCGNPVEATAAKPTYNVNKQISIKGAGDFHGTLADQPAGTEVEYKITVSVPASSPVSADNITVKDSIDNPNFIVEEADSLIRITQSGQTLPGSDHDFFTAGKNTNGVSFSGGGVTIDSIKPGNQVVFKYAAILEGNNVTNPNSAQCEEKSPVNNTVTINNPVLPPESDTAHAGVKCKPQAQQNLTCDSLTPSATTVTVGTPVQFTAHGTASGGATINSYSFVFSNEGGPVNQTSPTISHTFTTAGDHTVSVSVMGTRNGQPFSISSPECQVHVTATQTPQQTLACDSLTLTSLTNRTHAQFTAAGHATGGATVNSYTFDFGDGTPVVTQASPNASHDYANANTYTATVKVNGTVNGQSATTPISQACTAHVQINQAPSAQCVALSLNATDAQQFIYNASATYTTSGGATLTGATINWGDGTTGTAMNTTSPLNFGSHTYPTGNAFTAVAHLTFSAAGTTFSNDCIASTQQQASPVFSCDLLDLNFTPGVSRGVTVSNFRETAQNGAIFTGVGISWGDGTTMAPMLNPIGQTHTYAADGTYNIIATAHFTVNGQQVTATSVLCAEQVQFSTPPVCNCDHPCTVNGTTTPSSSSCTPPTTPPSKPTVLVNTGPGSVAALFAIVTAAGTFLYRRFLGNKLSQEL